MKPDMPLPERGGGGIQPGSRMNAIGDCADGYILRILKSVDILPHLPGDDSVELGDAVDMGCESQGQDGHAELLMVIAGVHAPEVDELFGRKPASLEHLVHGVDRRRGVVSIMSGGHRGMGGEDGGGSNAFDGFIDRCPTCDHARHALDRSERGMAFVEVVDAVYAEKKIPKEKKFFVAGHSMGGTWTLNLAACPETRDRIEAIAPISSPTDLFNPRVTKDDKTTEALPRTGISGLALASANLPAPASVTAKTRQRSGI